jgi:2-polyprenyl-3-methyl-5-hydroxy-6-metoxy-1,4-benzoquinol methylase
MKALDRYLRDVRIAKARKFVRKGDVVVDVGCADGVMFERWADLISRGYGVDPTLERHVEHRDFVLFPGHFPRDLPPVRCDVITMLAVLEHIPAGQQAALPHVCHEMLNQGGRIVVTVPSPRVDDILRLLSAARLIDGMSMDEHYGFDAASTMTLFDAPLFRLEHRRRFQLGLNNLFVFEKV